MYCHSDMTWPFFGGHSCKVRSSKSKPFFMKFKPLGHFFQKKAGDHTHCRGGEEKSNNLAELRRTSKDGVGLRSQAFFVLATHDGHVSMEKALEDDAFESNEGTDVEVAKMASNRILLALEPFFTDYITMRHVAYDQVFFMPDRRTNTFRV